MTEIMGFTGSSEVITDDQRQKLLWVLWRMQPKTVVHGDCVVADETFHRLARAILPGVFVHSRPCTLASKRAWCIADLLEEPKAPLDRNRDIAEECSYLVATPQQPEMIVRSGTWATVRYALEAGKPVLVIRPDGQFDFKGEGAREYLGVVCD
jgi:hypothetical protein